MAKESALYQLMGVRMNGVMNDITNSDGEYPEIHAKSTVLKWVKQYNSHVELTDSRKTGGYLMTKDIKPRKTALEECSCTVKKQATENKRQTASTTLSRTKETKDQKQALWKNPKV